MDTGRFAVGAIVDYSDGPMVIGGVIHEDPESYTAKVEQLNGESNSWKGISIVKYKNQC